MPPREFSRYSFTAAVEDSAGRLMLTQRERFPYEKRSDNRTYRATGGDTVFHLAARYFKGITDRPAGLWWVIADFQPDPIHDPTVTLERGRVVVIPSNRTVVERVFSNTRREEALE